MKILQVVPYFPPAYAFGGPVKVSFQVSKELVQRGHEVVVYTSDAKDLVSRLSVEQVSYVDGIKVNYFRNIWVPKLKLFLTPGLVSKVKEEVRQFDVIHLHEFRTFQNIIIHYYAMRYGVPYVLQAHGSLPRFTYLKWLKWIYDKFFGYRLLRDASKVIALNKVEAEQYQSMDVQDERIAIVPNGIDLTEYSDLPPKKSFKERYNIPLESKLILYLGRIHQSKRIDLLINSFFLVLARFKCSSIILVLMGPDDGYMDEAKSLAESLGIINSILFTGFVSAEDKRKALVDADIFVTPSFSGFPMTFLEACATGTPIITTTLGDKLGWINGKVGYVTSPTYYNMAEAIHAIVSNDELRGNFSRNCIKIVESNFSLEKVIDRLEHIYKKVI